jgi:hypothetical protein
LTAVELVGVACEKLIEPETPFMLNVALAVIPVAEVLVTLAVHPIPCTLLSETKFTTA